MAGDSRTIAEWRARILEELGGQGTDDDLTERELDASLKAALECYNKYRPQVVWFPFEVPAGNTTVISFFSETAQNDPTGNPYGFVATVLDVQFADEERRYLTPNVGIGGSSYLRWGHQGPRLFFELQVASRTYERLAGARPDWRWEPASRQLYITSPARGLRIMVLCSRRRRIDEIVYDQEYDFRRLAVASAKQKLARILGAHGAPPGAGGSIETDAAALRAEGAQEWKDAEQTLAVALRSVPPPAWVG